MIVFIGCAIVIGSIYIGFSMAGGHAEALLHISEVITIGGASMGALVLQSPKKVIIDLVKGIIQTIKGSPFNKKTYSELLMFLYSVSRLVRREGVLALEGVVANPNAGLFAKFPRVGKNHHLQHFLGDALTVIADGKADPAILARDLDEEIRVMETEHHAASGALAKVADGLPGFGIVAAVLGIVVTMQAIGGPVEEIGHKVGAALVGTFLGILASYGFVAPMAARMDTLGAIEASFFRSISVALVAICEGQSPRDVAWGARRMVGSELRPSATEFAQLLKDAEAA
ncbi:motility-associated protein [Zavarzinella formosa]|uniref:motility-associated protein n=1 Tax=Zavarzinella formosa TaxID=360055 RepID=UPI0002E8E234|nr:motility-associated protein [Zavarzinella formosa]